MKRSTIALAVCMGLSACSGQSNMDINSLNTAKRDAGTDAEPSEEEPDARPESEPDAAVGEQDAGPPEEQDAGAVLGDAGAVNDAGAQPSDASAVSDASAGDAAASNQLRVRVRYENVFPTQAAVFFSRADGSLEGAHAPDGQGLVVSDSAPAMVTAVLPDRGDSLSQRYAILTVVAPALGDFLDIEGALERGASTQTIRYLATLGALPSAGTSVMAYAGVDGCAQGYQDLMPAPTGAMQIGQRPTCQLESHGSLIAVMRDASDLVVNFAGITLPPVASNPVAITLDQWLAPEDLTLRLANVPASPRPDVSLWMRKGALTVLADYPDSAPANIIPFKVARGLLDSFDATAWITRSANSEHLFGKNRPASAAEIALDLNEALPELDRAQLSASYTPLLRPSASWGVVGGNAPADALTATFSWRWQPNSDTVAILSWTFVAPPNTTSLAVPALPAMGPFGVADDVPADAEVHFEGVEYYDSDAQSGYREFLRERLRTGGGRSEGGTRTGNLARDIPTGGNTRMARFTNERR